MKKSIVLLLLILLIILAPSLPGEDQLGAMHRYEISDTELLAEDYYEMIGPDAEIIMKTGRVIHVGDEYLTWDNRLFRVYNVKGKKAYAKYVETLDLQEHMAKNFRAQARQMLRPALSLAQEEEGEEEGGEPAGLVAIYHTHNAESYIPTDGTHSIYGKGGIHEVGSAFKEALEEKGVKVIHDETLHLPHDRGAYRRSRVTAQRLLSEGPDVIFDVHRDAAPMEAYAAFVDDEWVTQVQFVVGRQNHNFSINRSFAYDLKGFADEGTPELIKGVFFAQGNYNQDLTPLNLLLEVGAHNNTREAAEDGIAIFSDTVDFYFYGPMEEREEGAPLTPNGPAPAQRDGAGAIAAAIRTIFGILAFLAVAGLGLLWINAGSSQEFSRIVSPWIHRGKEAWLKAAAFIREKWRVLKVNAVVAWQKAREFTQENLARIRARLEKWRKEKLK